jgi:hypothetical protein
MGWPHLLQEGRCKGLFLSIPTINKASSTLDRLKKWAVPAKQDTPDVVYLFISTANV